MAKAKETIEGSVELKKVPMIAIDEKEGIYDIDFEQLPMDCIIVCEHETQDLKYNTTKKLNEFSPLKQEREFQKGFFSGVFDFNENGYSKSLAITILGYKEAAKAEQ